jgi:hypothetical protein
MVRVLPDRDAPLRVTTNQRMYGVLTANTPGCVAFSLPVQRRNLQARRSQRVFPVPPQPAPRAADMEWRFEPERRPVPDTFCVARGGLRHGRTDYSALEHDPEDWLPVFRTGHTQTRGPICEWPASASAPRRAFSEGCGGNLCRQNIVQTGQPLDAPDCIADQHPPDNRDHARRKLRTPLCSGGNGLGTAPRFAFWPSPHPRIRWTVASPGGAICARHATRPPPSRAPKCPTRC